MRNTQSLESLSSGCFLGENGRPSFVAPFAGLVLTFRRFFLRRLIATTIRQTRLRANNWPCSSLDSQLERGCASQHRACPAVPQAVLISHLVGVSPLYPVTRPGYVSDACFLWPQCPWVVLSRRSLASFMRNSWFGDESFCCDRQADKALRGFTHEQTASERSHMRRTRRWWFRSHLRRQWRRKMVSRGCFYITCLQAMLSGSESHCSRAARAL